MTATTSTINLLLVDDSSLVRRGIRAALEGEPDARHIEIVGEADTAYAALAEAQRLRPDVMLLDLRLPDDSGLSVCRKIRQLLPATCVIVLTSSTDDQSVYDSVIAGAQGYLLKEIHPSTLIQAIEDGHAGRPVFSGEVATRVLDIIRQNQAKPDTHSALGSLSAQERRVLVAIAGGHTNKEIAQQLGLSVNTVKNYIANMFQKLGIERRSQATALYLNNQPTRPE